MKTDDKKLKKLILEALSELLGPEAATQIKRKATPASVVNAKTKYEGDFDKRCAAAAKDRPTISGIGGVRIVNPTNPVSCMPRVEIIGRALKGEAEAMAELWYRANRKGTTPSSLAGGGKVKEKIAEHEAKPNALRDALRKREGKKKDEGEEMKPKRRINGTLKRNALSAAAKAMLKGNRKQAIFELKSAGIIDDARKYKGEKLNEFIAGKAPAVKPVVQPHRIPGGDVADLRVG